MCIIVILAQFHVTEGTTLEKEKGGIVKLKNRFRDGQVAMMGKIYKLQKLKKYEYIVEEFDHY